MERDQSHCPLSAHQGDCIPFRSGEKSGTGEVDFEYLRSCVYFEFLGVTAVATPQSSVPAGYAQEARLYAETSHLDTAELMGET
jgi:hypothetical protein